MYSTSSGSRATSIPRISLNRGNLSKSGLSKSTCRRRIYESERFSQKYPTKSDSRIILFGCNHLQRIHVYSCRFSAWEFFFLYFSQKTIENSHVLKRQLYAYAANDSPLYFLQFHSNVQIQVPWIPFSIFKWKVRVLMRSRLPV